MNNLFRAPAARAAKTLDRSLFFKQLPSTAAHVKSHQNLARYRSGLEKSKELLRLEKLKPVVPHPDPALAKQGERCLVLDPRVDPASKFDEKTIASLTCHSLTAIFSFFLA